MILLPIIYLIIPIPTHGSITTNGIPYGKARIKRDTKAHGVSILSPTDKLIKSSGCQSVISYYKNCRGSSHGWLITVDEVEQPDGSYIYPVRLLNPFRSVNNEIQLPPLTPIPELNLEPNTSYYLIKAYLSANPSSLTNPSDLIVLGVYGSNQLIFCRPGDTIWTHFPLERKFRPIQDFICYKGRFLAIIQEGSVLELDLHLHPPNAKFVAGTPATGNIFNKKYLVESGGDLLQVQRHYVVGDDSSTNTRFRAFKLKDDDDDDDDEDDDVFEIEIGDVHACERRVIKMMNDDGKYWVEMDNLEGRSLFLGDNSSISLSAAADLPGLMPNCIYFTDDNHETYEVDDWDGPLDIGVFNFEDKSVVLYLDPIMRMPPPIWIQPML